jgi:hypothetical protein
MKSKWLLNSKLVWINKLSNLLKIRKDSIS